MTRITKKTIEKKFGFPHHNIIWNIKSTNNNPISIF